MATSDATTILFGKGEKPALLHLPMANRHGLIAGATGTGKTVTVQVLAEQFVRHGVPCFAVDIKGDLAGLAAPGRPHPEIDRRTSVIGIDNFQLGGNQVVLWDLFGKSGHPLRITVSEVGPVLQAQMLGLNETQQEVMRAAFAYADDHGLLLLNLADLRALIEHIANNRQQIEAGYGRLAPASLAAIQRRLMVLERAGGKELFGELALEVTDLLGRDLIHLLDARRMLEDRKIYVSFLLYLLAELFEDLPEQGDADKPKLILFLDEAHLLFSDTPKALLTRLETTVRLIRSRGVGIYLITQNPLDIPDSVSSQLGNRIVHGLRAYTPREQKVIRAVAETFASNPNIDVENELPRLGTGEALVSTLGNKGIPSPVERVLIAPPHSRIGTLSVAERTTLREESLFQSYEKKVDSFSAYEHLQQRVAKKQPQQEDVKKPRRSGESSLIDDAVLRATRAFSTQFARELARGVLGVLKRSL